MSVIDEYVETLHEPERAVIAHMYDLARGLVPGAKEELSYAMPTIIYKDKGVVAVIANKKFISLYPFCNHERLKLDLRGYETTKGSIHFSAEKPLPDKLFEQIVRARVRQIDDGYGTD